MKRLFLVLFAAALMLTGCGVGSHTVVSGRSDEAGLIVFADRSYPVEVTIDHNTYHVYTVKDSQFKRKRNIRKTAENMITIRPGVHEVIVRRHGQRVLSQRIFVSAGDTKVITL